MEGSVVLQNGIENGVNGLEKGQEMDMSNNNKLTNNELIPSESPVQARVTRKAKRRVKHSPQKDAVASVGLDSLVKEKNCRKSRSGRGRGLPKKGGAGGKGTWGKECDVYEENDADCQDSNDPNYDSDAQPGYRLKAIIPTLTEDEFEVTVTPIMQEYFEHGDTEEVIACLEELNINDNHHNVPALAVTLALEKKAMHKEMTSALISDLFGKKVISMDHLKMGFLRLLESLNDLTLDTPGAPEMIGQFIARAIADDCLPPRFIQDFKGKVHSDLMRESLDKADNLLNRKHGLCRLDDVWGVGGGRRPTKILIKRSTIMVIEHLEDPGHTIANKMSKLMKVMYDSGVITVDQLNTGFQRVYALMPDLVLDVPHAYTNLEAYAAICEKENVFTRILRSQLPSRVRKRFVSEGDGGRFKETS
ncbi:programmed cell death protein 4-like isoform X2 [Anneissia japonica]|uniref:programmed cell death protein 4-like isoform X2 n=1 Tax=Anneissia japonica TaxID=1529436 RepID=UPI001425AA6B|nr:programmed cell death protein 4-like isoform X2 [Anneissia japonica]